ncbi:hypothetical protein GCM10027091_17030 [Streptomyces daliensis]
MLGGGRRGPEYAPVPRRPGTTVTRPRTLPLPPPDDTGNAEQKEAVVGKHSGKQDPAEKDGHKPERPIPPPDPKRPEKK